MHRAERRLAMVDRRLRPADRGEDRVGARRALGEGDEGAVVQLQRRRMIELAGVEEGTHQGVPARSAGRLGSESSRRIAAQRAAGSGPGALDIGLHHRLAEAVIDHIGAVMFGEGDRLLGAAARLQAVALAELDRLGAGDPAFEQIAGDGEAGAAQLLDRVLQFEIGLGAVARQAGERIEDAPLEFEPLVAREGELDAVIGRALGDEALRRIERVEHELGPAPPARQILLEQHVAAHGGRDSLRGSPARRRGPCATADRC